VICGALFALCPPTYGEVRLRPIRLKSHPHLAIPPCAHPFRAGCISNVADTPGRYRRVHVLSWGIVPGQVLMISARTWAEIMRTKDFSSIILFCRLPHQFLDAWFVDERIIVEAPGSPSAEDERTQRGGRLAAGLYGSSRALWFAGNHKMLG
jgi:hypothetical protein